MDNLIRILNFVNLCASLCDLCGKKNITIKFTEKISQRTQRTILTNNIRETTN
jgi:hypothetical protein